MPTEDEQRWIDKTDFLPGIDLRVAPPVMRYQLRGDQVYTLQMFPDGSRAAGQVDKSLLPFAWQGEGWYNGQGEFLGDDAQLPDEG